MKSTKKDLSTLLREAYPDRSDQEIEEAERRVLDLIRLLFSLDHKLPSRDIDP